MHVQKLSSTNGNGGTSPTDFARRVKNLFTGSSPLNKKRSMSLDALDSKPGEILYYGYEIMAQYRAGILQAHSQLFNVAC